jgi:hypothetical protein
LCNDCAARQKKTKTLTMKDLLQGVFVFVVTVFAMIGCTSVFFHGSRKTADPAPTPPASQAQPSKPAVVPSKVAPKPNAMPASVATPHLPPTPYDQKAADLQTLLVNAGQHVEINGQMDAQTKQAVIAFQRSHHLTADGIVGPQTRHALERADPSRARVQATQSSSSSHDTYRLLDFNGRPQNGKCEATAAKIMEMVSQYDPKHNSIDRITCHEDTEEHPGHIMAEAFIHDYGWTGITRRERGAIDGPITEAFDNVGMEVQFTGADSGKMLCEPDPGYCE